MALLTGIVFALLFLVVQFAATSQSPQLNLFRDNPLVWHTLGLIVGVLVYAATCAVVAASNDTTTVLVPISVLLLVLMALAVTRRLQLDAFRSVQLSRPATMPHLSDMTGKVIDLLSARTRGGQGNGFKLRDLGASEENTAGLVLRWVYGSAFGIAHVLLRTRVPEPAATIGFGSALFGMTMTMFPILGRAPPPWRWPAPVMATSVTPHVVYVVTGAVTDDRMSRIRNW